LDLKLPNALILRTSLLEINSDGNAKLGADYLALQGGVKLTPALGGGALELDANWIDLIGNIAITGVNKTYISSKSNKISILEKLDQIKKILNELNANYANEDANDAGANVVKLPKYISIKNHVTDSNKLYLVYDKKGACRCTLQVLCNKSEPLTQCLNKFLETINNKFGNKID
jgi:hypothetical protein